MAAQPSGVSTTPPSLVCVPVAYLYKILVDIISKLHAAIEAGCTTSCSKGEMTDNFFFFFLRNQLVLVKGSGVKSTRRNADPQKQKLVLQIHVYVCQKLNSGTY